MLLSELDVDVGPASPVEVGLKVARSGLEAGDSNLSSKNREIRALFRPRKLLFRCRFSSLLSSSVFRADRSSPRQLIVVTYPMSWSPRTRPHVLRSLSRSFDLASRSHSPVVQGKFASFSETESRCRDVDSPGLLQRPLLLAVVSPSPLELSISKFRDL